jgi:hypothetical protein
MADIVIPSFTIPYAFWGPFVGAILALMLWTLWRGGRR